jgi:hypothetical protein
VEDGGGDHQEDRAEQEENRGEVREYQENTKKVMEGSERPEEHRDGWNLRRSAAARAVVEEDFVASASCQEASGGHDGHGDARAELLEEAIKAEEGGDVAAREKVEEDDLQALCFL